MRIIIVLKTFTFISVPLYIKPVCLYFQRDEGTDGMVCFSPWRAVYFVINVTQKRPFQSLFGSRACKFVSRSLSCRFSQSHTPAFWKPVPCAQPFPLHARLRRKRLGNGLEPSVFSGWKSRTLRPSSPGSHAYLKAGWLGLERSF